MKLERVELLNLGLPLISPFRTSFGKTVAKHSILVKAYSDGLVGYGEASPFSDPIYSYETIDTAWHILRDFIVPTLLHQELDDAAALMQRLEFIRGHPFAKSGMEIAFWDLLSQRRGVTVSKLLGGTRAKVPVGISLGIEETVGELLDQIETALATGYRRIKLKIEPGWDVEVIKEVRKRFGAIPLQVDANSAYRLRDVETFRRLDDFGLLMIEQPLGYEDIFDHAALQGQIKTPVCLDESIHSLDTARRAIQLRSCKIINIKFGRVGGLHESRAIHDLCQENGIPVWVGGMLASGMGQCTKIELASLPNFSCPGDILPTGRLYLDDLIEPPLCLNPDGTFDVPSTPRALHRPNDKSIDQITVDKLVLD